MKPSHSLPGLLAMLLGFLIVVSSPVVALPVTETEVRVAMRVAICGTGAARTEFAGQIWESAQAPGLFDCGTEVRVAAGIVTLKPNKRYVLSLKTLPPGILSSIEARFAPLDGGGTTPHRQRPSDVNPVSKYGVIIDGVDQDDRALFWSRSQCAALDTPRTFTVELRLKNRGTQHPPPGPLLPTSAGSSSSGSWAGDDIARGPQGARGRSAGMASMTLQRTLSPMGNNAASDYFGDAYYPDLSPGRSPDPAVTSYYWKVSLGMGRYGGMAGLIHMRGNALSAAAFSRSILEVEVQESAAADVIALRDAMTQELAQIGTPQGLVDIVPGTDKFDLRFYLPGSYTPPAAQGAPYVVNAGAAPIVTYVVQKAVGTGSQQRMLINETRNGVGATSELRYDPGTTTTGTWQLISGTTGAQKRTQVRAVSVDPTVGVRTETITLQDGNDTVAYKAVQTLKQFPWGWEITGLVENPDDAAQTLEETWNFGQTAGQPGYGRVTRVGWNDGYFQDYTYTGETDSDIETGVQTIVSPWADYDPSVPETTRRQQVTYALKGIPSNVASLQGGTGVEYAQANLAQPLRAGSWNYLFNSESGGANGGHTSGESVGYFFNPDNAQFNQSFLRLQYRFQLNPDRTATQFAYDTGDLSAGTPGTFTPSAAGLYWRVSEMRGSTVRMKLPPAMEFDDPSTGQAFSVPPDYPLPDAGMVFYCVPGQSTKKVLIRDVRGWLVQDEFYVYKWDGASTTADDSNFVLVEKNLYQHDVLGHVTLVTRYDGVNNGARQIYAADWKGAAAQPGDLKLSETDANGVVTQYQYDALKRVSTTTKLGVAASGGFASQADIVQTVVRDANGMALSETLSGGGLTLVSSAVYDKAGRIKSQTDARGLTTGYDYTMGGQTTTITLPGNAGVLPGSPPTTVPRQKTIKRYTDRRPKSIEGNAVIPEFYTYSTEVASDYPVTPVGNYGASVVTKTLGTSSSGRFERTYSDMVGQPSRRERPGPNGNLQQEFLNYDSAFHLVKDVPTAHDSGGATPVRFPTTYYEYSNMGKPLRAGQPANDTSNFSGLNPASLDRVTDTKEYYEVDPANAVFLHKDTLGYLADSSAAPTSLGTQKQRLSGFSDPTVLSQVITTDALGQATTTTTSILLSGKRATTVTDVPDSSIDVVSVSVNGLLVREHGPTTTANDVYAYDGLGRQTSHTTALGVAELTVYGTTSGMINAGQPVSVTALNGTAQTLSYYSATDTSPGALAGELSRTTRSDGTFVAQGYTPRGELQYRWGSAVYPEQRVYNTLGEMTGLVTYRGGTAWEGTVWPASPPAGDTTTWSYDPASGVLLSKTDAKGKQVTYTYHDDGTPRTQSWTRNPTTTLTVTHGYNSWGDDTGQTYSDGTTAVTRSNHDRRGLPRTIVDGAGSRALTYDEAGRTLTETFVTSDLFQGVALIHSFDATYRRLDSVGVSGLQGSPTSVTTSLQYDPYGRFQGVTYLEGAPTPLHRVQYVFQASCDLVQEVVSDSVAANTDIHTTKTWSYGYRLAKTQTTVAAVVRDACELRYDTLDRVTGVVQTDGGQWIYGYNNRDEVTSGVKYWSDFTPVAGGQYAYAYDNQGNRTWAARGGDASGGGLRTETYSPNELNQYAARTGTVGVDVTGVATANAAVSVTLTPPGQAGSSIAVPYRKGEYYRVDVPVDTSAGARVRDVSSTATLGANVATVSEPRQYLPPATQTFAHSEDGTLVSDGVWNYTWDARGQLIAMESVATLDPAAGKRKVAYGYDHAGRRVSRTESAWNTAAGAYDPGVTTLYVYDGWRVVAELDSGRHVVRAYGWGRDLSGSQDGAGGVGGLVLIREVGSEGYFPVYDGNGNVKAVIKASDRSVAARYDYGPFGEPMLAAGPYAAQNRYRFSTKPSDPVHGHYYYGYRYYSGMSRG